MKRVFLIKISDIKRYSFIDENVSELDIMNTLLDVQETMLEELLGTELYEDLIDTIEDDQANLTSEDEILIQKKIHKVLIHGTAFKLVINKLFRITKSSVSKDDNQNSKGVLRVKNKTDEKEYVLKYLIENADDFPKYTEETDDGIDPSGGTQPSNFYIDDETEEANRIDLREDY